jgi:carbonic anhydrase/acetyltransferase-like protein (isoleucine patch superfamily)
MTFERPRRTRRAFQPSFDACELRLLLSARRPHPPGGITALAQRPRPIALLGFEHPVRPNTPVLPFGVPNSQTTFIDPTVHIKGGLRIAIGRLTYFAPFAALDARGGGISIGGSSAIFDNATIVVGAVPASDGTPVLRIGDATVIAQGASVRGASVVGTHGPGAAPTYVGPNALLDGATIEPGAFVSAGASVASGITIAAGIKVLPGAVVTTQAEANDPGLGKVTGVTAADLAVIRSSLSEAVGLATGYTVLYQGSSSTGASPGATVSGVFNGNLAAVSGVSRSPGSPATRFPAAAPRFPGPNRSRVPANLSLFRGRVIGGVVFGQRAGDVAHRSGRGVSIRADVGQPITIGSVERLGNNVTIHALPGGRLTIGQSLRMDDRAVLLGGPGSTIGNNVTIGAGAVVSDTTVGSGAVIGPGAILLNTTVAAGEIIPAGTVRVG